MQWLLPGYGFSCMGPETLDFKVIDATDLQGEGENNDISQSQKNQVKCLVYYAEPREKLQKELTGTREGRAMEECQRKMEREEQQQEK